MRNLFCLYLSFLIAHGTYALYDNKSEKKKGEFEVYISEEKKTCLPAFKIDTRYYKDKDDCQKLCEENSKCEYFFHSSIYRRCMLYKDCSSHKDQTMTGSTYKKMHADKDITWFKKLVPRSCRVVKKNILDVRIAMEECENDEECIAVSDEGCNMKGTFGICRQLATFSSANNCVYQKKNDCTDTLQTCRSIAKNKRCSDAGEFVRLNCEKSCDLCRTELTHEGISTASTRQTTSLDCIENTSWKTINGYRCADYAKNKWCENGGKGSAWEENWKWETDSNGLDAQSVCCICGGNKKSVECYSSSTNNKSMECANGNYVDILNGWNGCIHQGSVRVRCPKGNFPCNKLAGNGEEFSCWPDCSTHGGRKECLNAETDASDETNLATTIRQTTKKDMDGPRINIDKSSDEHNQEKNSGNTTAISGGIGGAVCLVALIAAVAVKQKRDSDRKIAEEIELEDINNKHIYDSVDEIQDERRPSPSNVEKTFNIEKEIKHAVIVECDENPYYEEFDSFPTGSSEEDDDTLLMDDNDSRA